MASPAEIRGILGDNLFGREGLHFAEVRDGRFGRIEPVTAEQAQQLLAGQAGVLDARGRLVLPAFIDSHAHILGEARRRLEVNASGVASCEELVERLRESPRRGELLLVADGLDFNALPESEQRQLKPALDAAFPQQAVQVKSIEHHSCWFNEKAWELVRVDAAAGPLGLPPVQLEEMRDSGRVHGPLYEALSETLYDTFTVEERRTALAQLLKTLPARGIGGVHSLVGYGTDRRADIQVTLDAAEGSDRVDLVVYPRTTDLLLVRELGLPRIGGCILLDGAIGARTAAVREPYADAPGNFGVLYFTDSQFAAFARGCAAAGLQLCVHAIGDAAIEQGLRIYRQLAADFDLAALRPRIDHFCLGTPEQCARAAALGVASGMQPAFDHYWGKPRVYVKALGEDRALAGNPLGTALRSGMIIGGGSDAPITPLDPRLGIHAACTHSNPAERLDFAQAVALFTTGSASLAHMERTHGAIAPGCQADLVVLPPGTDGSNIHQAGVLNTIHRGRVVYERVD